VFTIWKTKRLETKRNERDDNIERISIALDMAKFYAEELIPDISLINEIIEQHPEIKAIVRRLKPNATMPSQFNSEEVEEVFTEEERKNLEGFYFNFSGVSVQAVQCCFALWGRAIDFGPPELQANSEYMAARTQTEMKKLIKFFMNKLEYFSMAFQQNVADEDVVYQSLHQSFFDAMIFMYFPIASRNKTSYDKFFVNAIQLFNTWRDRLQSDKKKKAEMDPKTPKKV